jgi:hypothetical protein
MLREGPDLGNVGAENVLIMCLIIKMEYNVVFSHQLISSGWKVGDEGELIFNNWYHLHIITECMREKPDHTYQG